MVLAGVRILECAALGPVPWGVDLLMEMGASVTRICRPGGGHSPASGPVSTLTRAVRGQAQEAHNRAPGMRDPVSRPGREDVFLDLKNARDVERALELAARCDVLIEGMRPGVMERLGLGPAVCAAVNPRLVYARVTGWGQSGPLAQGAGHDINYIALSGVLHTIGLPSGPPVPPLNLVGDYGGGGTFLVIGVLGALLEARRSGHGCVVDVSMLDSAVRLLAPVRKRLDRGQWVDERGANEFDGGAPWYSVYAAKCGGYLAVGAIEDKFYREFLHGLGLDPDNLPDRGDRHYWGVLRALFAARFLTRTRAQWVEVFGTLEACVTPVLSLREAPLHPHNRQRQVYVETTAGGFTCGVAPRFFPFERE